MELLEAILLGIKGLFWLGCITVFFWVVLRAIEDQKH